MTTLAPGDIAITSYYADGADATTDNFSFVSLVPLAAGTVIYFTDAGWVTTGGFFGATEDVVTYTVSAGGLPAGSVITLNGLSFNVNGDSIIAYQAPTATTGPFTNIFGVDFADSNTTWAPEAINTTTSSLPAGLTAGTTGLAFGQDNGAYTGPLTGTREQILANIANPANWTLTNNATPVTPPPTAFVVAATVHDDAAATAETAVLTGSVFADNGGGADVNATAVTEVNGMAVSVGTPITLASGALLTLNADGTFSYDPNGAFTALGAAGSGASNTTATDSFTYTANGGGVGVVTITVNGQDTGHDILFGTALADTISAGIGNDTVSGLDGDDTLNGGAGSDILNGGLGVDTLNGDDGADKLNGDDGADILNGGVGNDLLRGGAGDDTLNGGDGVDNIDGGAGADAMAGGLGNDLYFVDDSGDTVTEAANAGFDIVRSTVSYVMADNLEGLQLQGGGDIDGTGNALANVITGNSRANVLSGGAGADVLDGGGGDDTLIGGLDRDRMTGGTGADTFVITGESITPATGGQPLQIDFILDATFSDGDRIDLSAIDADSGQDGDQAFTFVDSFTRQAGEAVLFYSASQDVSILRLDVDGDGRADYQAVLTGQVGPEVAAGSGGGWVL